MNHNESVRKLFTLLNEEIGDACDLHITPEATIQVTAPYKLVFTYFTLAYNIVMDHLVWPNVEETKLISTFEYKSPMFELEIK